MPDKEYEKVVIYPYVQFVPPNPRTGKDYKLVPVRFPWLTKQGIWVVTVDEVLNRVRAPATHAGGHGYQYQCRGSWLFNGEMHTQQCVLWFDPRRLQWFVEVPISRLPQNWEERYRQLGAVKFQKVPRKAQLAGEVEGQKVRAGLYPLVHFVARDEQTRQDYKLVPVGYVWECLGERQKVTVNDVTSMMRASTLKHRGRGYRYSCISSWQADGQAFMQQGYLWFDADKLIWEAEVPINKIIHN